jgi:hypothetical protein
MIPSIDFVAAPLGRLEGPERRAKVRTRTVVFSQFVEVPGQNGRVKAEFPIEVFFLQPFIEFPLIHRA